jgi:Zn-dependent M28 family amino/carboxypeptidase
MASEGAAIPAFIAGVGWSDHWAFWEAGYPAFMVTDTAPFRYPYYHTTDDTPDKLVYPQMTRVVDGLIAMTREIAGIK